MEQPLITVRTSWHGDVLLVAVSGEIDLDTAPRVRSALRTTTAVVLDLREVTFFGSTGIQLLLDAHHDIRDLAVVASSRTVLRALEVTDLARYLPLCPSPDAAFDHVRRTARTCPG
ncbi:anti-anti-sigma factor [Saccharothrix tamanrassetensis]|uniref:Anti-sigma factor antagonist n=1 Tax=Saccharothrix tamanrassetensis TaxID=1051531 RepID=A0A841CHS9_9PSEU|nr:STAS domain-containing protein [Saccharothrix tamanrassetensis]MBB5956859.1 anti-anti-sigma factor [Saccharothrix tamanrassetensis]